MFGRNRAVSAGGGLYRTLESENNNAPAKIHPARKSGTGERRQPGSGGILTILLRGVYSLARVPNHLQSL
jgi:hypothetical protein